MDVVTEYRGLFREKAYYKPSALMFDVAVTSPLGPTALARAGTRAGYAIEEVVKAKNTKFGGKYRPTYNGCNCKKYRNSTDGILNTSTLDPKIHISLFQVPFPTTSIRETRKNEPSGPFY